MIYTAIALLSLTALIGMLLLPIAFSTKRPRMILIYVHGPLGMCGMVLLNIYRFEHVPSPVESIVLFFIASLTGLFMIYRDHSHRSVPRWIAVGHGIISLVALVWLLIFAVKYNY